MTSNGMTGTKPTSTQSIASVLSALLIISVLLQGCGKDADTKVVDFSKTSVTRVSVTGGSGEENVLRVAVGAMISPKETFVYHRRVLEYLAKRLGKDIQVIQRKTYRELNELFGNGMVDAAFICSGPYALEKEKYGFELLATPEVRGMHFYQAYLIVNANSPYQSLGQLRGKIFAFTDPDSNTGKLVPTYWLAQIHERPETFFSEIQMTRGHDNSILAVAWGLVDGASVDSLIWEYFNLKKPEVTAKTRIIKKSKPFGIPPIVVSRFLDPLLKDRMRRLLLSMHLDAEGKDILKELMIDRFIVPREEWYLPIRQMRQSAMEASYAAQEPQK